MKQKLILTLLLLLAAVPATAQSFEVDGICYEITDNYFDVNDEMVSLDHDVAIVTSYHDDVLGDLIIPSEVSYEGVIYPVEVIGPDAFYWCDGLTSVVIPNSVTYIGWDAFAYCFDLESVTIGNSVTTIGSDAFSNCSSLMNIDIPNSVTYIGGWAFEYSGLTSVTIPNSVTYIGYCAFICCYDLTDVYSYITDLSSVTVEGDIFDWGNEQKNAEECTLHVPAGMVEAYQADENWGPYFSAIVEMEEEVEDPVLATSITLEPSETQIFIGATLQLRAIIEPENATNNSVTWSTSDSTIATVDQTGLVTAVAGGSAVITVTTNDGTLLSASCAVTVLHRIVFVCPLVRQICVDNWDTNGDGELDEAEAAAVTSLNSQFKEKSITSFDELQYFTGLTSIEGYAFNKCSSLTSICIPDSVTSIGKYAFDGCSSLTSIVIPNCVTSIGKNAFDECSGLTSIDIPNSVTSIGDHAFAYCSGLTSIDIPNSVTRLESYTFIDCRGLKSISLGNSINYIYTNAFLGCSGLTSIMVDPANPYFDSRDSCNAIIETASNTLRVGCKKTIIPNTVTTIGSSAFEECTGLRSIEIPNSVTTIGSSAFSRCSGLTSIVIPNSVTSIGSSAFYYCKSLMSVDIPNSITSIGNSAFGYTDLRSVDIPNSVTTIGNSAFSNCVHLYSINIPDSITTIGKYAFDYCHCLESITLPNTITSIGERAFNNCYDLKDVYSYITDLSVVSIGFRAFYAYNSINPNIYPKRTLHVPSGMVEIYQADDNWGPYFGTIVEMEPEVTIPGDVDGDGVVGISDVTALIDMILTDSVSIEDNPAADVNGDGMINIADVTELIDRILTAGL